MTLGMFEESNGGFRLPHPALSLRFRLVVELAICAAWELMSDHARSGFDLQTADEDAVTLELYERLYDEVFDKGVVEGFNRQIIASIHREPKVRNFNGSSPDKMPDMLVDFIDRPQSCMHSQHGLFIECKPVDRKHPTGSVYCEAGLIRFVRGDYAWAMQDAMMVGYVRTGYSLFPKLSKALQSERRKALCCPAGLTNCPCTRASTVVQQVAISEHEREFHYENAGVPGVIVVRHLWLVRA